MTYHPLVTIVIPVYNGAEYVSQAIESALNQTYENIEILVINDGSPDHSEEVIMPYTDRVVYIKKGNGGVSTALNYAIDKMKGIWLSWLSHDDLYLPQKIEEQIKQLNEILVKMPGCNIEEYILSCQDRRIDENGNALPRGGKVHPKYADNYELVSREICDYTIGGCTVLAARSAYLAVGGFDESNRTISDADMWFKLMLSGYKFVFSNDALVLSRYHKNMVSVKRSKLVEKEKDVFYKKAIETILPHISSDMLFPIAIAMAKAALPQAAAAAKASYKGSHAKLSIALIKARIFRSVKAVLRKIYRKVKWGGYFGDGI